MKSNETIASAVQASKNGPAKLAGVMFLLALIVPLANWAFVLSGLLDANSVTATANNIQARETLFRLGLSVELFMAVSLVVLGLALYVITKPVNKSVALLALLLKLLEAMMVSTAVLVSFIALQFMNANVELAVFTPEQLRAPVGLILSTHKAIFAIPMIILGLDMMLFFYLFWKSNYLSRILAGFGFLSFALVFAFAFISILAPK